jgi:hypothetical protein
MTEHLVQYVEDFCDHMEDVPIMSIFGKQMSRPASIAALRAFYYIEKNNSGLFANEKLLIYECFRFVLTDEGCHWNNLTEDEKIALMTRLEVHKVLVFY